MAFLRMLGAKAQWWEIAYIDELLGVLAVEVGPLGLKGLS